MTVGQYGATKHRHKNTVYRGGEQNILNLISFATPVYDKTKLRPHTDHSIIKKKQAQTRINCKE